MTYRIKDVISYYKQSHPDVMKAIYYNFDFKTYCAKSANPVNRTLFHKIKNDVARQRQLESKVKKEMNYV